MRPSQVILRGADRTATVTDKAGRRFLVHRPTALDTLRLFKAAGPVLAQNEPWLAMASLASAIREIDGIPVPVPSDEAQIEALVDRLGDDGLTAVAEWVGHEEDKTEHDAQVGNLPGTPS